MLCDRISKSRLWMVCLGLVLLAGCFPEDTLDWSADGRVGLLRSGNKLFLVDGGSGALTPVPAEDVGPWPDMAPDGSRIAFAEECRYETLEEGLKALPPSQAKTISSYAQNLYEKIVRGDLVVDGPDTLFGDESECPESCRAWVARLLWENADEQFRQKLGDQVERKIHDAELKCSRIVVMSCSDFSKKDILTTSGLDVICPRLSPDGKNVAYLTAGFSKDEEDEETASLYVVSRSSREPMFVTSAVALGYNWRPDSQAIAYLRQDEGEKTAMLGAIFEQRVCDADGRLLADISDGVPIGSRCTGESRQLVGTLFDPLTKIEYGAGGRLFFSSASITIPSSDLDESKYSVFCYDAMTGVVSNILPPSVADCVSEGADFFSLSPDGARILLPMEDNRFGIYELGTKSLKLPVEESEKFDKDNAMIPSWKGNGQVTCQVSPRSRFVAGRARQSDRNEVVVLNAAGDFQSMLSGDWPDDALPGASKEGN
jgi:Tol biopolymer transport system component